MDLKLETRNSILYLLPRSALILLTVLLLLSLSRANADTPHRAGVIVQHGDGSVQAQCVTFPEESITGLDVLLRSGLDLNIDASNSMGATICRLDGEGCTFPQQDCFCQCTGSDCVYWSYWRWENGTWVYSNLGASSTGVTDGGIEGWVWGQGNSGASPPPSPPPIDDICAASDPTPTPTLTDTPVPPTPVPTATDTPIPTPVGTPVIHTFTADRTDIVAGETVALRWDLSGAEAAFLRYNGAEEGVVSPGEKILSPMETTTFTLLARSAGGEVSAQLTITVRQPTATPVPTDTPIPPSVAATPTPAGASNAARPTDTPSPTATPVPPTSTPSPTATSTATAVRPTARVAVQLAILPTATPVPTVNRMPAPPTVAPTPAPRSPFGGMIWVVIALFIAVPMALLGGAVIWWLVKKV